MDVKDYYDNVADNYHKKYDINNLHDISKSYPGNYFRLQLLLNLLIINNIKRVIEVGVGEGTPLSIIGNAGIDVWGFDLSEEMVKKSRKKMQSSGINPDNVFLGDIQEPTSYISVLKNGRFDGLIALGVMPHVVNDYMVLKNMSTLVKPGGSVFIEFRNKLFSLFTFNNHTITFILDDLLQGVDNKIKDVIRKDLELRLNMNKLSISNYDKILSKFHNPFEVRDLFKQQGFTDIKFHWYHYHSAPPYLSDEMPEIFREESMKLEYNSSNWKGLFLCSAFIVEAVNG